MKENVIIFGTGSTAKRLLPKIESQYKVTCFVCNDDNLFGGYISNYKIYSPDKINQIPFDKIIVASLPGLNSIMEQLTAMGVQQYKIITHFVDDAIRNRISFLNSIGLLFHSKNIEGSVAECGVFQGEFAAEINRVFPNKTLHLFDTFTGFDERDILVERQKNFSNSESGHLNLKINLDYILKKLPYPENAIIHKGYFPETAKDINEAFCFVNLDFDLYKPTLSGLEFFYPLMCKAGIILIHDYFGQIYSDGIQKAVEEFDKKVGGINSCPVGDEMSLAVIRGGGGGVQSVYNDNISTALLIGQSSIIWLLFYLYCQNEGYLLSYQPQHFCYFENFKAI